MDTQTTEEAMEPRPGDPNLEDLSGAAPSPGPGDPAGDSSGAEGAIQTRPGPGDPAGDLSGADQKQGGGAAQADRWIPPLTLPQWSGSIPSTDQSQGSEPDEPTFPTDEELVEALRSTKDKKRPRDSKKRRGKMTPGTRDLLRGDPTQSQLSTGVDVC